jgi:outer membrane biosynthesis protein TonB
MTSLSINDNRNKGALTMGAFIMNYKFRAVVITIAIHAAIILFLWLFYIYTPIPPFPSPVNTPELELDLAAGGGGSSGSSASKVSAEKQVAMAKPSNTPTINNDVEPSTPIPSGKSTVVPKKTDTVPKPPQPSIELANAESKFKNAKSSGNGNAAQGDKGNGNGGNGSTQGTGSGPSIGAGKGFGYDLVGRQLEIRPQLVTNNPEQGQIVVGITVDQDGNVTEAVPGVRGSTITDASLYILVKNAAMKVKFNKSTDTPEQSGTVTFRFTIQ